MTEKSSVSHLPEPDRNVPEMKIQLIPERRGPHRNFSYTIPIVIHCIAAIRARISFVVSQISSCFICMSASSAP